MSRGNREAVSGIINHSMRNNYSEYGVDEYYKKVAATYRNPHFPGVRQCMYLWLNKWWENEESRLLSERLAIFDMACGSGEATIAFMEWWSLSKSAYAAMQGIERTALPSRKNLPVSKLPPDTPTPEILAADPYTSEAFETRTKLKCSSLSFRDIAEGSLPPRKPFDTTEDGSNQPILESLTVKSSENNSQSRIIEMTFCSFALHLVETPSELFALLWELSTKCRWLIVLAPHKKPDIKDGWGWSKWDANAWSECPMTQSDGEFLQDRVHCRIYHSLNCP